MSKRLILILALAFVVGIAFTAYAEVQNVKVSGDITVKGVSRDNLDLAKTSVSDTVGRNTTTYSDKSSDLLSITRVRVDADLTDNVSTTVRLLNERNWNGESNAVGETNRNIGSLTTANNAAPDENDVDLDLAYVTLKEFLYSPLSLSVGRQLLRFGNGLVVGDPDTNIYSVATGLAEGDLSARKSFDALRATLDYDPLVVDLIYAKVEEGNTNLNDDVTLTGVNASYALNKATTLEGFLFSKVKGSNAAAVWNIDAAAATGFMNDPAVNSADKRSRVRDKTDQVHTVGLRMVNNSINNLALDILGAFQLGTYNPKFDPNARWSAPDVPDRQTAKRGAWAMQVEATYDLKDIKMLSKYSPSLTGNYTYLSGEDRDKAGSGTHRGWDPMFEDQTYGHLMNAIIANTNMHRAALSGKAKLTDDISAKLDYTMAWFAKRYPEGRLAVLSGIATNAATARQFIMGKTAYIGTEVDLNLTYDYTEDVQFSLLGGILMPGKSINERDGVNQPNRVAATEVIGSMKVTF